jgi:hypothetical protein
MSAGTARTNKFLISAGTVLLGMPNELWDLTPEKHSLGLVKNVRLITEPDHTVLSGNGRGKGNIASNASTLNASISMEVHEVTSRNIAYALGLEGRSFQESAPGYRTTLMLDDTSTVSFKAPTDVTAEFPVGSWIMIQDPLEPDVVHHAQVSGASQVNGDHNVTFTDHPIPAGSYIQPGALVRRVSMLHMSEPQQPFFSMKITGELTNHEPISIICPKVRIKKGFSLAVSLDNYASLPFVVAPHDLLPQDAFYPMFRRNGPIMITSRHNEPNRLTLDSLRSLWSSTSIRF